MCLHRNGLHHGHSSEIVFVEMIFVKNYLGRNGLHLPFGGEIISLLGDSSRIAAGFERAF